MAGPLCGCLSPGRVRGGAGLGGRGDSHRKGLLWWMWVRGPRGRDCSKWQIHERKREAIFLGSLEEKFRGQIT